MSNTVPKSVEGSRYTDTGLNSSPSHNMPLIDLTLQHGQTLDEARRRLQTAVDEVNARFGSMIRRTEWAADRNRVKLDGVGFWAEMSVDVQVLHATGDIPILGQLLGNRFTSGLRQIVERTFQKKLPP
jgi:Putative polyhydroxyalkanoic acid system protein (PHA_gran_rgn)